MPEEMIFWGQGEEDGETETRRRAVLFQKVVIKKGNPGAQTGFLWLALPVYSESEG